MHTITAWSDAEGAARAADLFRATFEAEPDKPAAPGRVNLIGEHVDYNGGLARRWPCPTRRSPPCGAATTTW